MTNSDKYSFIEEYISKQIGDVFKKPYGCFKHPFVDPGSVYNGNLWDWDSYWSVYSLINIAENRKTDKALCEKIELHAKGNVLNFFDFQLEDGYIPMMVEEKGEGEPYLLKKHKEGFIGNMHKPFLCQQICIISGWTGSFQWIFPHISALERYFECYDRYYLHDRTGLYVWADDVMIGMDNDPATFGRPRFSTANIFLNSFMVLELRSMAKLMADYGDQARADYYSQRAKALEGCIQNECWDKRDRFFYSVDVDIKTRSYDWFHQGLGVFWNSLFIKVRAWSSFLPMYAGLATDEQAAELVKHMQDESTFCAEHGIRSLSGDEKMYNLEVTNNPSNWLGPIWLIVQYLCFQSLNRYGYKEEAKSLCAKTVDLLVDDIIRTGTMHEYYVPETGAPIMNSGFLNWNMLALNMADELEGRPSVSRFLPF